MPRIVALLILVLISLGLAAPAAAQGGSTGTRPPANEAVDLADGQDLLARAAAIDLTAYPILPAHLGQARAIFERGQALGRDARVMSKVGDCNSVVWQFLHPFGENQYDLGPYAHLQPVVDYYATSFATHTQAGHAGLNSRAITDPFWTNPNFCEPEESSLQCEYRLRNPAVAMIMFGTNDMFVLTPEQFDQSLRSIVQQTIDAGIVPVLSTFPRHLSYPDRSVEFNKLVVRIALDFDIPLVNLWLALEPLPTHGIARDGYHLDGPVTFSGDLATPANLATGYPLRNLITLQTLDLLLREVVGIAGLPRADWAAEIP